MGAILHASASQHHVVRRDSVHIRFSCETEGTFAWFDWGYGKYTEHISTLLLHDPKFLSLYELFRSLSAYGEVSMCSSCLTQHSLTSSTHSTAAHYTTNYYFYIFLKYFITYFFFSLCMFSTCFSRAPAGWYCIKGTDECSDSCSRQELGLGKSAGIFYRSPYLSLFFISSFFVFILPPSFQSPCLYHLEQPN